MSGSMKYQPGGTCEWESYPHDIFKAAEAGDVAWIRSLLAADPTCKDLTNNFGGTPMTFALQKRHQEAVAAFLEAGEDPNHIIRGREGTSSFTTYLHKAVTAIALAISPEEKESARAIFKNLLDHPKINLDQPDSEGNTPYISASIFLLGAVMEMLRSKGADTSIKNKAGENAEQAMINYRKKMDEALRGGRTI
ncbi:MAG: ankyrin repeat domain-containing protein [Dongiaceae bacterium]